MRAIVVGGGIAGPALGMALVAVGAEPIVLEAASTDRAAGSWFTIAPNGLAALDELDALDPVRRYGVPTRANVMVGATGSVLGRLPLGRPLDDGTPALSFRRPDLSAALMAEAAHRGVDVRHGARAVAAETADSGAAVVLADGTRVEGDIVIGADGIRSIVRTAIDPQAAAARYVGLANFGGVTRGGAASAGLDLEAWTFVFGRRAFFGGLPTPDGDVVWFVNEPREPVSREERAGTSSTEWRDHLVDLARPDAGPFADLIAAGELDLAGDSTYDLPTVRTWHRGRLALIGDALHAPSPSSGQGASMALEDAVVLAARLRDEATLAAAFASFETARRARVERIVADGARSSSSKTAGPIARIFQDAMLRWVFRHLVTERSTAATYDHRVSLGRA
ncbi:FAD-dependent monooxygenase [Agromyces seonyuensis]|uniref:FAD-dependent monooxygenase n=1 Tax=Agromyces seonyuensis TaxID=2662446 RepID=A0A6I4NXG2_9MICO|nr:FAD-dependent monooxygenase [Agromyces seonyuensis]MWB97812.1 FAD-dependent monooxygenase [Agromyces seonyuensis]